MRGGGAEHAIRAVARALARRTEVALYAPEGRSGEPEPGIETVAVPIRARTRRARARELARALSDAARARGGTLVACGKILGADVVWPHGGVHAASREASSTRHGSAVRSLVARAARRLRPVERVFDEIERENVAAAQRGELVWVALSERVRRDLARHLGFEGARVVRNGVELDRFRARSEHGEPRVRALFCAHAFVLKGLDRALKAVARVPGATLEVVGRGEPTPWLKLARVLGAAERVTFAGEVSDVPERLARADVLLHPTRYDPCSLVVLEALAASVPVITTREDGASELVGDGGFVLERPDDPAEAAEHLKALTERPLRERLSAAARRNARSVDACAEELVALAAVRGRA